MKSIRTKVLTINDDFFLQKDEKLNTSWEEVPQWLPPREKKKAGEEVGQMAADRVADITAPWGRACISEKNQVFVMVEKVRVGRRRRGGGGSEEGRGSGREVWVNE